MFHLDVLPIALVKDSMASGILEEEFPRDGLVLFLMEAFFYSLLLMIIYNFNMLSSVFAPGKYNTILIVNSNTIISLQGTLKSFKMICWWYFEITKIMSCINHV